MADEGWNTEPGNPGMKGPMFDHHRRNGSSVIKKHYTFW